MLTVPVGFSLCGPLFCSSPLVVFLDRGHPCFWNFSSIIPVDVIRVKSYVNRLFEPLPHPKADSVQCCEHALKRLRSGYGLAGCLSCAPLFSLA